MAGESERWTRFETVVLPILLAAVVLGIWQAVALSGRKMVVSGGLTRPRDHGDGTWMAG